MPRSNRGRGKPRVGGWVSGGAAPGDRGACGAHGGADNNSRVGVTVGAGPTGYPARKGEDLV